jgi:16S rRNA (guanine(966)-N(2))-methyltransferase RsmD
MFMALEPLADLYVVDLFAGSGALGIEALSRGARHVDFVESEHAARVMLDRNLAALGLGPLARVWPLVLPRGLTRLTAELRRADLVLADPPYGGDPARALLRDLGVAGRLHSGARVVVEHHGKDDLPEQSGCVKRVRMRRYGETAVSTFEVVAAEPATQEDRS